MSLKSANERQYPIFGYRVHTAVRSHFSFAFRSRKKSLPNVSTGVDVNGWRRAFLGRRYWSSLLELQQLLALRRMQHLVCTRPRSWRLCFETWTRQRRGTLWCVAVASWQLTLPVVVFTPAPLLARGRLPAALSQSSNEAFFVSVHGHNAHGWLSSVLWVGE